MNKQVMEYNFECVLEICSEKFNFYIEIIISDKEKKLFVSIPEKHWTKIPHYFVKWGDKKIKFNLWDSKKLGTFIIMLNFNNPFLYAYGPPFKKVQKVKLKNSNQFYEFNCYIEKNYQDLFNDLRYSNSYSEQKINIKYSYDFENVEHHKLEKKYNFKKMIENKSELEGAIYIMRFLHKIIIDSGEAIYIPKKRSGYSLLIEREKRNLNLNCRCCAIILNDVLLSLGYKAKIIVCRSKDYVDPECHVTNMVWINELHKWIVLDCALQTIVCDSSNNILTLFEIKQKLLNHEQLYFCYNINKINYKINKEEFIKYLMKNMYLFSTYEKFGPYLTNDKGNLKTILLVPKNDYERYKAFIDNKTILTFDYKKFFEEDEYEKY